RGIAEAPEVAAEHHRYAIDLEVAAEREQELVRIRGGAIEREPRRRRELAIGREPARKATEDIDVRVALAQEGAELAADHPTVVARHVLVHARLRRLAL